MDLPAEILQVLTAAGGRRRYSEVWGAVARNVGREIAQPDFEAAVAALCSGGILRRNVLGGGFEHLSLQALPSHGRRITAKSTAGEEARPSENQLMPPLKTWLEKVFRHSLGAHVQTVVQDTAHAGPRSGVWSRPDFTVAAIRRFTYSTVREVELYGFELKRSDSGSVIGVHEALAHTRWVHYSYFVWHTPDRAALQDDLTTIRDECARHGLGLVTFADPARLETWQVELEAEKATPDSLLVDTYINERFTLEQTRQLASWLGEP